MHQLIPIFGTNAFRSRFVGRNVEDLDVPAATNGRWRPLLVATVYRTICAEEARDDDHDGVPDVYEAPRN